MLDLDFMHLALSKAKQGILEGQSPFGCLIQKRGQVVSVEHNTVCLTLDPTAHAEINAIRMAAHKLGTYDLSGCTLYSTCEPCPMCLSASHWAKIDRVVYGATIDDAARTGFSELRMYAKELAAKGRSHLKIESGCLSEECAALFAFFKEIGRGNLY